ncbi:hypothetical protein GUITHDRAFT_153115, partial [Guillardia theta CCMP2712]
MSTSPVGLQPEAPVETPKVCLLPHPFQVFDCERPRHKIASEFSCSNLISPYVYLADQLHRLHLQHYATTLSIRAAM